MKSLYDLIASTRRVIDFTVRTSLLAGLALTIVAPVVSNAESRAFVVSMLHTATYSHEDNCPDGVVGDSTDIKRRQLLRLGYSEEEAKKILLDGVNSDGVSVDELYYLQGPDQSPVDLLNDPTTAIDPGLQLVSGEYAPGFNLDGDENTGFPKNPYSSDRGIDNDLYRTLGCYQTFDISLPVVPYPQAIAWDIIIDTMPAWIFTISGEDLDADGDVEIRFYKALQHSRRTPAGEVLPYFSFVAEPDSRTFGTFPGKRIGNRFVVSSEKEIYLEGELLTLPVVNLKQVHLSFEINTDGSLSGFIGGYQPWKHFYDCCVINPEAGLEGSALYHAWQRLAVRPPGAKTGEIDHISAAYVMNAVPAHVFDFEGRLLGTAK